MEVSAHCILFFSLPYPVASYRFLSVHSVYHHAVPYTLSLFTAVCQRLLLPQPYRCGVAVP
jgi:hypothetical protein